ncbi:MAG: hypothetical protein JWN73_2969 [Betaproteobacteria bacterium]|nr:hypothetical protein [Betaproteobacteria bacterium]
MKLADMYKSKGSKINGNIKPHGALGKPSGEPAPPDRREQRKLDQAKGLVPFACKLEVSLIAQIRTLAEERKVALNDLVAELLNAGLQGGEAKPKAEKPKAAKAKADA